METRGSIMKERATVTESMERLGSLAGYGLSVHPQRCVRVRNRHASCRRCADACTSGAISFDQDELVINQALCVGCGTCATVCPTCAIEACHPNDAELLARASLVLHGQHEVEAPSGPREEAPAAPHAAACVTFACGQAMSSAPDACARARAIGLICLSRIDESLAVELFARGAHTVRLVHGHCDGCPRAAGMRSVRLVERTLSAISQVWNVPGAVEVLDVSALPGGAHRGAESAREAPCEPEAVGAELNPYLRIPQEGAGGGGHVAGGTPGDGATGQHEASSPVEGACVTVHGDAVRASYRPVHVGADGTLPHFVPVRRHRLLDALDHFEVPSSHAALDTRLWGHIRINEDLCRSCKMCAVFCPTGALQKFTEADGTTGVEHYPAECVHCGLCQDICPAHAIISETRVPVRLLVDGQTERYDMPAPAWWTGPDQILRKMRPQISGNDVRHSY